MLLSLLLIHLLKPEQQCSHIQQQEQQKSPLLASEERKLCSTATTSDITVVAARQPLPTGGGKPLARLSGEEDGGQVFLAAIARI